MGLFAKTKRPEKNKTAIFYVDVEGEVTEDEFNRLKQWVRENIPSTERFTPEWKPNDDWTGSPPSMEKVRFRFKFEEHAMAFKLIL